MSARGLANPKIMPTVVFLNVFGAHMNILFIVDKLSFLSNDNIGPSRLYESTMVNKMYD